MGNLSPTFVAALLQASITGAGLILAAYALILPIASRILMNKAKSCEESYKEFENKTKKLTPYTLSEDRKEELKELLEKIYSKGKLPSPLSMVMGVVFLSYLSCAFLSVFWFIDPSSSQYETLIPGTFLIACLLFLYVGWDTIRLITESLEKDYDDVKKSIMGIVEINDSKIKKND